jgi:hypothetical protein
VRGGLTAASALAAAVIAVLALPASAAGPTWKTVGPFGVGIRCSFNPCVVGGFVTIRAVGVKLPPKKGKIEWSSALARHYPTRISLTYKGRTIRIPDAAVDQMEEVEPVIQHRFGFNVRQASGSPFLKTGLGTGTLKFRTRASGAVSIRVPVKITRID